MRKHLLLSGIVSLFLSATSVAETVNFPEEIVPLKSSWFLAYISSNLNTPICTSKVTMSIKLSTQNHFG